MKRKHEITNDLFVTGSESVYWYYLNTDADCGCQIVETVIKPAALEGTEGMDNETFWDHISNCCDIYLHDCAAHDEVEARCNWNKAYNTWLRSPHFTAGTTPESRATIYRYFETLRRAEKECKAWGI